jgi:hypothetical protein
LAVPTKTNGVSSSSANQSRVRATGAGRERMRAVPERLRARAPCAERTTRGRRQGTREGDSPSGSARWLSTERTGPPERRPAERPWTCWLGIRVRAAPFRSAVSRRWQQPPGAH